MYIFWYTLKKKNLSSFFSTQSMCVHDASQLCITNCFDEMSTIDPFLNCQVCAAKALVNQRHSRHYDGICCLSCRAFFRRIVQSSGNILEVNIACRNPNTEEKCDLTQLGKY